MKREEKLVLKLLCAAICGSDVPENITISADSWSAVLAVADRNAVLPMLYDVLEPYFSRMHEKDRKLVQEKTLSCVRQYYYLSYLTANVQRALWGAGIQAVAFKGVSAAAFYPHPAYRKSGDIDLFLPSAGRVVMKGAETVLHRFGFYRKPEQTTVYHIEFLNDSGPELELHTFLSEPFESERTNRAIEKIIRSGALGVQEMKSEGERFRTFGDAGTAFSLLIHMLHHYVRAGFGLKFLADWVVFWNGHPDPDDPVKSAYREMILSCGIDGFSDAVTGICEKYLGLHSPGLAGTEDDALCREFMEDIFRSGEFGEGDASRMVALGNNTLLGYLREFQHQTKLNFPGASAFWPLYPVLWARTLFRFLQNNRKVRHTSLGSVMREAGKRGEMSRRMHLFEKDH